MLRSIFAASPSLSLALTANSVAVPPLNDGISWHTISKRAFAPPSEDVISSNALELTKSSKRSRSSRILTDLMNENALTDNTVTKRHAPSASLDTAMVVLDTGSSDTWLIQSGFTCFDANAQQQPESMCQLGPAFNGTYTGGQISDEDFYVSYYDRSHVSGTVGYEDVTLAGLTVSMQEVSLVNEVQMRGDGISSGIIGLAYESLTQVHSTTDQAGNSTDNSIDNAVYYPPIFQSMYTQGLTSASFSLALDRDAGGYIAFGGLPPVKGVSSARFVSTPIQYVSTIKPNQYPFYAINANIISNGTSSSTDVYIVDSGAALINVPTSVAVEFHAAISPPAQYFSNTGGYWVDCDATPPTFEVNIAGTSLTINPDDLISRSHVDNATGLCPTNIYDAGSGPNALYILGDRFLVNVVAVFDVGANEMRFAALEN